MHISSWLYLVDMPNPSCRLHWMRRHQAYSVKQLCLLYWLVHICQLEVYLVRQQLFKRNEQKKNAEQKMFGLPSESGCCDKENTMSRMDNEGIVSRLYSMHSNASWSFYEDIPYKTTLILIANWCRTLTLSFLVVQKWSQQKAAKMEPSNCVTFQRTEIKIHTEMLARVSWTGISGVELSNVKNNAQNSFACYGWWDWDTLIHTRTYYCQAYKMSKTF